MESKSTAGTVVGSIGQWPILTPLIRTGNPTGSVACGERHKSANHPAVTACREDRNGIRMKAVLPKRQSDGLYQGLRRKMVTTAAWARGVVELGRNGRHPISYPPSRHQRKMSARGSKPEGSHTNFRVTGTPSASKIRRTGPRKIPSSPATSLFFIKDWLGDRVSRVLLDWHPRDYRIHRRNRSDCPIG